MSTLTTCPTCSKSVSSSAWTCPGCGEPLQSRNYRPVNRQMQGIGHAAWGWILFWFMAFLSVLPVLLSIFTNEVWYYAKQYRDLPQTWSGKTIYGWQHGVVENWGKSLHIEYITLLFLAGAMFSACLLPGLYRRDRLMREGALPYKV